MREVVKSSWFARFDLLLVIVSGVAWLLWPDYAGALPLLLLLLPWVLRLFAKVFPFQRTPFDWLMLIFLVTAWVGCWSSYNHADAINKAWLLTASVFLFYALSAQPEENITRISSGLFMIGVGVSVYFFFTHNFIDEPRKIEALNKIGALWTNIRPQFPLHPIHPNYVSGLAALTAIFGFYPLQKFRPNSFAGVTILTGFAVVFSALVMATSRGVWMAIVAAGGVWLLWKIVNLNEIKPRLGNEAFFPSVVLIFLCIVVVALYMGPATWGSSIIGSPDYGTGSRAELFARSLYFLADFPIIGGGLASFSGLYSQYMLGIPYFYVPNSHNLFLDVFIEQGVFGGVAFFLVYLVSIWYVSRAIVRAQSSEMKLFNWVVLFALVIAVVHGMVDDYLYNGKGAFLSVFLAGISMIVIMNSDRNAVGGICPLVTGRIKQNYIFILLVTVAIFAGVNFNKLFAVWYANLGAVQLAKVELADFPQAGWADAEMVPRLDQADASLHTALRFDPLNRTANHRLGLISMLRRDFSSAVFYLHVAHAEAPRHRGIIKSLGFSYAWLGEMENGLSLLRDIPEAKNEFDVYFTWWKGQGRDDLSEKAFMMYENLKSLPVQP